MGNKELLENVISPREALSQRESYIELDTRTEQGQYPRIALFFSLDIVNSTVYKERTGLWPIIIRSLVEETRRLVCKQEALQACSLWRVIGDETVFVLQVTSKNELVEIVDAVFEVTQRISISLRGGKFFESLENQMITEESIKFLKEQNSLSIKSAAWIAPINKKLESIYDNITYYYNESAYNAPIREYIGRDIDTGFRLKSYTQDRRLIINLELAYFLAQENKENNLHIIGYERLKGVWNEALYPIIWYYNKDIDQSCRMEMLEDNRQIPFNESFRYDEIDGYPLVREYFLRQHNKSGNIGENDKGICFQENIGCLLSKKMFVIPDLFVKIKSDRNLSPKFDYINSLLHDYIKVERVPQIQDPLAMHCAVVCCNVDERSIMIIRRGDDHTTNPNKWEFGCAHASSTETIVKATVEHYKTRYGVEIELVMNSDREEKQPLPIAVYEVKKTNSTAKGIIFVGKVLNTVEFRPNLSHDERKWIDEKSVENIQVDDAVIDFHNTIRTVFQNFDRFFE